MTHRASSQTLGDRASLRALAHRVRRRFRRRTAARRRRRRRGSRRSRRASRPARPGSAQLPASDRLTITVVLRPSHTDQLDALLRDLYDPASPRYGTGSRPASSTASSGRAPAEVDARHCVAARARACTDTSVEGMAVRATGAAQDVARRVRRLVLALPARARARPATSRRRAPLVPAAVAGGITHDRRALRHGPVRQLARPAPPQAPAARRAAARGAAAPRAAPHAAPVACATAAQLRRRRPVLDRRPGRALLPRQRPVRRGAHRQGQDDRAARARPEPRRPTRTSTSRASGCTTRVKVVQRSTAARTPDATGTLEAEIDIQEAATQAPGATILSYEAPNNASGEYDAYSRIVTRQPRAGRVDELGQVRSAAPSRAERRRVHRRAAHAVPAGRRAGPERVRGDRRHGSEDCYDGTTNPPSETLAGRQSRPTIRS